VNIAIYQDTACPWCRIGKKNLKTALSRWQSESGHTEPITISYHPFFLDPTIPDGGLPFLPYMRAKGGGQMLPENWFAGPRDAGARVGVIFNFDRITVAPNTLLSHELIALAPLDKREAVIDAIYDGYFANGQDIGDPAVLIALATEAGLDGEAIRVPLMQHTMRDSVLAEIEEAVALGITGVPFFVINDHYAFSGAQPAESILRLLRQVAARETSASA